MAEDPSWLTETFLASVIQGGEHVEPKVVVKSFTATPAVAKGNNYMSIAYRVRARYVQCGQRGGENASDSSGETKTAALIIKAPITQGMVSEFQEKLKILEVEPSMYDEVLPKINGMLGCQLNPHKFYCPMENAMVLADLGESGYVMCDKTRQLDFAHCAETMVALGRYHAATVRLHRDEPTLVVELGRERLFVEGSGVAGEMRSWLIAGVTAMADIAIQLPGCQEIAKYLLGRAEELPESLVEICKKRDDRFNVLNHGDLWVNNMLFKHDNQGHIEDVKLIDFQMVRWNSPALDILYFIWTSANEDSRNRTPDLLSKYLQSLNDTLEKLGCQERLSKKELEAEMLASSDWVVMVVASTLPMMMCSAEDALDSSNMTRDQFEGDGLAKSMKSELEAEMCACSDWAVMVVSSTLPMIICSVEDAIDASNVKEDHFEGDELVKTMKRIYGGKNYNVVLPAILKQLKEWLL